MRAAEGLVPDREQSCPHPEIWERMAASDCRNREHNMKSPFPFPEKTGYMIHNTLEYILL